jgi:hypothetical protein
MTSFRITVEKPAVIDLPNDVKKIVVIDNTDKGKAKVEAVIDGVLSGEQVNGDKMAADVFPDGMMQSLRNGNYIAERVSAQ